uniref:Uncharacterized protein n=1 Tax=Globodera rostochiensis TaxID=31243 RepID=A0A914H1P6_GLORO
MLFLRKYLSLNTITFLLIIVQISNTTTKNAVKKTILRQWEDDSQFAEFFESLTVNVGKVCQSQRAFGGTVTTLDKHWKWLEEFDALSLFGKIVVAGVKERLLKKLEQADMWHTLQVAKQRMAFMLMAILALSQQSICTELTKLGRAMHKRRNDTANLDYPKVIASAFHNLAALCEYLQLNWNILVEEDEWMMRELKQLLEGMRLKG